MNNKVFLTLLKVIDKTGLSRSLIYQLISEDSFPKQISLSARRVGWDSEEIDKWMEARIAARGES